MLLTKKKLNTILEDLRIQVPAELKNELLDQYGNLAADDTGRVFECCRSHSVTTFIPNIKPG